MDEDHDGVINLQEFAAFAEKSAQADKRIERLLPRPGAPPEGAVHDGTYAQRVVACAAAAKVCQPAADWEDLAQTHSAHIVCS